MHQSCYFLIHFSHVNCQSNLKHFQFKERIDHEYIKFIKCGSLYSFINGMETFKLTKRKYVMTWMKDVI